MHSDKQYDRLRYPSLKTTISFRTDIGPSPGAPCPPRMQVGTHFLVHCWTALPLGPSKRDPNRGFLVPESSSEDDKPWGTVSKYVSSALVISTAWARISTDEIDSLWAMATGGIDINGMIVTKVATMPPKVFDKQWTIFPPLSSIHWCLEVKDGMSRVEKQQYGGCDNEALDD